MDIIIRNICPVVVGKINNLAKEKGMSREEFLREQLEIIADSDILKVYQDKMSEFTNKVDGQLSDVIEMLFKVEQSHDKVFRIFAMYLNIPLEDLKEII